MIVTLVSIVSIVTDVSVVTTKGGRICYNVSNMQGTIILLTGTPGAGKTTVAEGLSATFSRSAHVSVDFFRKQIKAGYASPHHWNEEVERQYSLARKNAALTARNIALQGFTVIIDDIIRHKWVEEWKHNLAGLDLRFVLLLPPVEVALHRNRTREIWTVDEAIITSLHRLLGEENTVERGWFVIDNSQLTIHETVQAIKKHLLERRV